MTLSSSTDHGTIMVLSGSTGHRHGFRWWQGLWILAHLPTVAHITNMKMASGSSMNSGDLWRRPNSEMKQCLLPVHCLIPHSSHLQHIFVHQRAIANFNVSHIYVFCFVLFCFLLYLPKQLYLQKYSLQKVTSLVQGFLFLMHHKYWTIAKAHLGLPTIAQSQGDLATRQGIWEQDSCELLVTAYLFTLGVSHPELCLQPARSGVLLPQVLLLSSRQVVWAAAEEILCCGLAQLANVMIFAAALSHTAPIPLIPQLLHGS